MFRGERRGSFRDRREAREESGRSSPSGCFADVPNVLAVRGGKTAHRACVRRAGDGALVQRRGAARRKLARSTAPEPDRGSDWRTGWPPADVSNSAGSCRLVTWASGTALKSPLISSIPRPY
jgi:hypothetical protein